MSVCRDDIHIVSGDVRYTVSNHPFPLNGIHIIRRGNSHVIVYRAPETIFISSLQAESIVVRIASFMRVIVPITRYHCRSYRTGCACILFTQTGCRFLILCKRHRCVRRLQPIPQSIFCIHRQRLRYLCALLPRKYPHSVGY